jgi:hypothetical protein
VTLPVPIRAPVLAVHRAAVKVILALARRRYKYVFILSHMRSGSTLLSHLFASHPDFSAAGETHVTYRSATDLPELLLVTCQWLHKLQLRAPYVVDQINHNRLVATEMLSSPLIDKCVILTRSPEGTVPSLLKLYDWQEVQAVDYYVDRLAALAAYGRILGQRAILVDYDDLVDRTEDSLAALTEFFGASVPFAPTYVERRSTGRSGDPSSNIHAGRIIRTSSHGVEISAETLARASEAFLQCRRELLDAGVRSVSQMREIEN